MENNEKETFNYTYSAKEQEKIKAIRSKYESPKEEQDKMSQLLKLDQGVTKKASIVALVLGIIGALILGTGMSLAMTDLGNAFNLTNNISMTAGIVIGVFGIILVSVSYPIYNRIVKKERERIAPEIIRLTDELMK